MAELVLKCGTVVLLDDEDYEKHKRFSWRIDKKGYAIRKSHGRTVRLHREVIGAAPGQLVDHIDQVKTNNCRSNLRFASSANNQINRMKFGSSTSKMKGVSRIKASGKWRAGIGKVNKHIGTFDTEDEAAHAYNKAAIARYGEFACLNPIGEDK